MRITDPSVIRPGTGARKASSSSAAAGFSDLISTGEASQAGTASAASSAAPLNSLNMLAFQEVSDEEARRQRAVRQGHNMIDALESLRRSLLMGAVPMDVLITLDARLSQQRELTADPHLHAIMDEIELRVAVEKAKLESALKGKGA